MVKNYHKTEPSVIHFIMYETYMKNAKVLIVSKRYYSEKKKQSSNQNEKCQGSDTLQRKEKTKC